MKLMSKLGPFPDDISLPMALSQGQLLFITVVINDALSLRAISDTVLQDISFERGEYPGLSYMI